MDILVHNEKGATIHLDGRELLTAMVLIQQGHLSFASDDPAAQALDELFCTAVSLVEEARMPGRKTHFTENQPRCANQTAR
jgi:hypothetical protein